MRLLILIFVLIGCSEAGQVKTPKAKMENPTFVGEHGTVCSKVTIGDVPCIVCETPNRYSVQTSLSCGFVKAQ